MRQEDRVYTWQLGFEQVNESWLNLTTGKPLSPAGLTEEQLQTIYGTHNNSPTRGDSPHNSKEGLS